MSSLLQVSSIDWVQQRLLGPADLTDRDLEQVLGKILSYSVDFADLYFQRAAHESWVLEDGIVKAGGYHFDQGVGVRAISGEKTGFAYSEEIGLPALKAAASAARAIASSGADQKTCVWRRALPLNPLYSMQDPLNSLLDAEKLAFMRRIDAEARRMDPRIKQVVVHLSAQLEQVLVVASDGGYGVDTRPLVQLNVDVIAEANGKREGGHAGGGGRSTYDLFFEADQGLRYAREAVRQAIVALEALAAPAGTMTVVLGPGWPGVLLHEAIGHGLEGDFNRKGSSAFANRLGERVASKLCTVVDNGAMAGRRGSLQIDDEGTPTQCTPLIEKGVLVGYLQDKLNGRLMGGQSTGNGRRESYAHLPLPRMTNTYMLAGSHTHEEIISSVQKGLYAVNFDGGEVDITSGKFVFSTNEAYLIEKGKVTRPVKGATLVGNGPDILMQVSMVGDNLALDEGVGVCGKEGQSVPVGVGQPTLRIDGMTVGGTE